MAKQINSVIGIDLGQHTLKAIHVVRRGEKLVISGYGHRPVGTPVQDSDALSHHLKLLLADVRGGTKPHAVALSSNDSILRVIEQPTTPLATLRKALALNSSMVLHQEAKDYVFDCGAVEKIDEAAQAKLKKQKYLVAGLPHARVGEVMDSFAKLRLPIQSLSLPGVCLFNAFEVCRPAIFRNGPFMLLDMGYERSLVVGGTKGALTMVRSIDYGGKQLISDLSMGGAAVDIEGVQMLLEQGDAGMADAIRDSIGQIAREVVSSIGFFEGQLDQTISRLYFSGGPMRSEMVMQIISDELDLPGEQWDAIDQCEVGFGGSRREQLNADARTLNVAFGAAVAAMDGSN